MVLAGHGGVNEFDDHVLADTLQVAIAPVFKGIGRGFAAAFLRGALVSAAARVRVGFVRGTPHDVDATPVRLPAWDARSVVFVSVSDAAVMLFFKGVLGGIGIRIAARPESLDELLALFIGGKMKEGAALFRSDDIDDVFVQPLLILRIQLLEEILFLLFSFFCGFLDVLRGLLLILLGLLFLLRGSGADQGGECQRLC